MDPTPTVETTIVQINDIYSLISSKDAFRAIRRFCRGIRSPNLIMNTLVMMVSVLQSGKMCDKGGVLFSETIGKYLASFDIQHKINDIQLFVKRLEKEVQNFCRYTTKEKKSNFIHKVSLEMEKLQNETNQLTEENFNKDRIHSALSAFNTLMKNINNYLASSKDDPSWSQQAKSYESSTGTILNQALIISQYKEKLKTLHESLCNLKIPTNLMFAKKSAENTIPSVVEFAMWANADNQVQNSTNKKEKKKRPNDENDDEFAKIPPKNKVQYHMRPYKRIQELEIENNKLKEFLKLCPHSPSEIKQLRQNIELLEAEYANLQQELEDLLFRISEEEKRQAELKKLQKQSKTRK